MTTATARKTSLKINTGPIVTIFVFPSCPHSILLAKYATSELVCATLN